jgi:predicted N-formylglutamate amidohydrolase
VNAWPAASFSLIAGSPLLLSCEHGGNRVPDPYAALFAGQSRVLASHRGYDVGALAAARYLRRHLGLTLIAATTTRLLVDLNRSPEHPRLFSEFTRALEPAERERILARHYRPYRERVTRWLAQHGARDHPAVHVSVHSFAASLNGRERRCDIGLLYDPSRPLEVEFCRAWQAQLGDAAPGLVVRRNYPYQGIADGLVTWLRRRFDSRGYAGIELEINQSWAVRGGAAWRHLLDALASTLPGGVFPA